MTVAMALAEKQKTPLPGLRTVSTQALPFLGGDVVHNETLIVFLVRQTLLEREVEKVKVKVKEQEEQKKRSRKSSARHCLARLCGDDWNQRGQGEAKLLLRSSSGEVWFVMRDEWVMRTSASMTIATSTPLAVLEDRCSGHQPSCLTVHAGTSSTTCAPLPRSLPSSLTRRSCGSVVVWLRGPSGPEAWHSLVPS